MFSYEKILAIPPPGTIFPVSKPKQYPCIDRRIDGAIARSILLNQ
jgi:hypothetical protein